MCRLTVSFIREEACCGQTVSIISFTAGSTRSSPIVCGFVVFAICLDILWESISHIPNACQSVKKKSNCSLFCFFVSKLLKFPASIVWMHSVEMVLESTRLYCLIREDGTTNKPQWTSSVMWSCCKTKFYISAVILAYFLLFDLLDFLQLS